MSGSAASGRAVDAAAVSSWLRDRGVYVAFLAVVLFNLVFTSNFATTGTLFTQLVQVSPVVLVSLGMALAIGTEGIDLSVGSVMALAAATSAAAILQWGWTVPAAVIIIGKARP